MFQIQFLIIPKDMRLKGNNYALSVDTVREILIVINDVTINLVTVYVRIQVMKNKNDYISD